MVARAVDQLALEQRDQRAAAGGREQKSRGLAGERAEVGDRQRKDGREHDRIEEAHQNDAPDSRHAAGRHGREHHQQGHDSTDS